MKIIKTIEDIIKDSADLPESNPYYQRSYQSYTAFFNNVKSIDEQTFLIGVGMAYSWMPTIPAIDVARIPRVLPIANDYLKHGTIGEEELQQLVKLVNNSIVGTSKLLHFIRPDSIPIWDSRVYHYLTGETPYYHHVSKVDNFLDYKEFCEEALDLPQFSQVLSNLHSTLGDATPLRALELVMFSKGRPGAR